MYLEQYGEYNAHLFEFLTVSFLSGMLGYVLTVSRRLLNVSSLSVIFVFLFVFF